MPGADGGGRLGTGALSTSITAVTVLHGDGTN